MTIANIIQEGEEIITLESKNTASVPYFKMKNNETTHKKQGRRLIWWLHGNLGSFPPNRLREFQPLGRMWLISIAIG